MKKTAVLLINLGTPESPSPKDVGLYLKEFLTDPEVISIPWLFRQILVRLIIVPIRKFRSAKLYSKIWTRKGSPLSVHSQDLKLELQKAQPDIHFELCFRYGKNNIAGAIERIKKEELKNLLILPLYPQYATSSTRTCLTELQNLQLEKHFDKITTIKSFHDQEFYLSPMSDLIQERLQNDAHLIFSFHGIPENHLTKNHQGCETCVQSLQCKKMGDELCYKRQCSETAELLAKKLNLNSENWSVSYQSRLGRAKWISPSTTEHLSELQQKGIQKILVAVPGFAADCLETLEEIDHELYSQFKQNGGQDWGRVPCLNSDSRWISNLGQFLAHKVKELENA